MKKRVWSLFLALALCLAMMPQTALAETSIKLDGVNAEDGSIKKSEGIARTGPALTASDRSLNNQFYIVQGNITIDGDLTVDGTKVGGLVLAAGATLTINGALKHNGGNMFCIYGQTSSSGETGQLIIKNSKDDGAAIRTTAASASSTPSLHIYSGKVTIHGGRSGKLVEGVELYNGSKIHKGTLDGKAVSPAAWTSKSVIEGNTLVLAYCDHGHATYVPSGDKQHTKKCADCGFVGTAKNCGTDGVIAYVSGGEEGHYQKCACGNKFGDAEKHDIRIAPTDDETKHISMCVACGYTPKSSTAQEHTYVNGICKECGYVCSHSGSITGGTCSVCHMTGIVATIGSAAYTKINDAVTAWLTNGGTLTLHDNGSLNTITDFSSAKNKNLVIDLNGHRINCDNNDGKSEANLGGVNLTIRDSKSKTSSQGAFGTIVADNGSLTLESGYIKGLTVRLDDKATIHLRDGKVDALICAKPIYTLLDDGYALMNGNITVDPTQTLASTTETYTVKNAQITNKTGTPSGSTSIGSGTLPFDLSLKTNDKEIGRVQFYWYRIDDSGTAALLAESKDVQPDKNGVYRYDTTTNGNGKDGWTGLQAEETYDLICVVVGKTIKGAYEWQAVLKGYKLKIEPASLASEKTVITQQEKSGNTGNPADNRLVVNPTNSYVGMSEDGLGEVTYLFDVTYNGIKLELGKDYTIQGDSNKAKNAGAHDLTIVGKGNYTGTKTVKWTIEPYELPSKHPTTQITKPYDGTTDGKNITNGKSGLGIFAIDSTNKKNPQMWSGGITSINFHDCFTLSNMYFDAAEVGDRTFFFTLTLKTDNFVFADGKKSAQFELKRNGSVSPYIYMAVVDAPAAKDLQVANKHAATYTVDLAGMLPQLTAPCEYGKVTYTLGKVQLTDSSYYDGNSKPAKIENGKLILPIKEVDGSNEGEIGKVTVTVSSTNYRDFTLTINVNAVNKIIPALDGKLTLSKEKLTYGEQLSTITLSGAMTDPTDGSKTVAGTFAWAAPETAMNQVGDYQATWKFTPVKGDVYAETTGTVAIPVEQAVPIGTPLYKKITVSDKTLADAELKATEETTAKSCFTANGREVAGTIKWVDKDGNDLTADLANIKVVQGESYKWLFTPTDQNYKELSGTIALWAKPSSGGFVTPAPVNPDVITVKEETKDNSISKPGAETGTTTTTKTTVKTTTTEMTKNEQGQDISKTTASVSKDLGDKLLDQAVSNKSDTIEITVKSSDANNSGSAGTGAADSVKATEVELPKATVNSIAKDTNADLVIKTDNGEVVLDNKTLETIAGAAKGDTVTIVVGENTQLKETQKPAEKIVGKNGTLFDLAAKIGEKLLHQFEGGKAHVTLPMPEKLKGKEALVIYIDDNGLCKILNHSVAKIGAEDYIRFTTTHFSTFAVVDKDEAERLIKEQNAAHVKELMQSAKFKVTTTKTSKKSVKVQVTAKSSKTMISDIKSLGYTLKYQFYRSTKKTAGYKVIKTKAANTFTNTKGTKGTKYYYKARVLVYDGKKLVAKSALRQCSWGSRTWTK